MEISIVIILSLIGWSSSVIARSMATQKSVIWRISTHVFMMISAIFVGISFFKFFKDGIFKNYFLENLKHLLSYNLFVFDSAFAAGVDGLGHANIASNPAGESVFQFAPFIMSGIFIIMGVAFLFSLSILMVVDDVPKNKNKIAAADNIVKTFSGFFVGIATSFFKTMGV